MSISVLQVLERALRDVAVPIDGVSVDNPADRSTWSVQYAANATAAQKSQGNAIVASVDPQDPAIIANIKADLSQGSANEALIRAIVQGLYGAIQTPTKTLAQVRNDIRAIYQGLL